MNCKFCHQETLMTVRDAKDSIIPCCKDCKDFKNEEKMTLYVHMIIKPFQEKEEISNESYSSSASNSTRSLFTNLFTPAGRFDF